jgi:competence protein ComEC
MSGYFFYTLVVGFAGGIFLRSFFDIGNEGLLLVLLLSFVMGMLWRRNTKGISPARATYTVGTPLLLASIALFSVALGMLRLDVTTWHVSPLTGVEEQKIEFSGLIAREPDVRVSSIHLYVRDAKSRELILVTTNPYQTFSYGDTVSISGVLKRPESFEGDLGRTFNYPGYLRARGVEHVVSFADVAVVESGGGNFAIRALLDVKHALMASIESLIPEPQAGLSEGLLLGVKRALGENLDKVFRVTGIIHIVVLSGYNIMIVVEATMRVLSLFFFPRTRAVIGALVIIAFALMVGLSATVVRASVMAGLVMLARSTGRVYAIMRALMLAGVVMLILNPYLLVFDPGFQLSFLATLGLVLIAPHIEARLHLLPTKFHVREFVTATIATQLMVLPLLLYLMGTFSVVAVPVNVLVLPAVPFAMLFTFTASVVGFVFAPLGIIFGYVAHLLLSYIITVATLAASIPIASFTVPAFPFWIVLCAYGVLAFILVRMGREVKTRIADIESDDEIDDWTIVTLEEYKQAATGQSPAADEFPFR